jgi:hypothetical protein
MSLLLVTYDPIKTDSDYAGLHDELNRYSNVRLSSTSYAIITDKSPSAVCGKLKKFIDVNDKIFVINLKPPYDGYGSQMINDWLKKTLAY